MIRFFGWVFALGLASLIVLGAIVAYGSMQFKKPGPHTADQYIMVMPGSTVTGIANQLHAEGVINQQAALIFPIVTRIQSQPMTLKAGEYKIETGLSAGDIMQKMANGQTVQRQVTIPEGLTSLEIINILNDVEMITGDPITDIPAEGTLLPESFTYSRYHTRQDILDWMTKDMNALVDELWPQRAEDLPYNTKQEAVILASIVEKETGVSAEREKVAGVFTNRLRIGMPLQTDPTVIYALTEGKSKLDRPLYTRDLKKEHPYNTYLNTGLPPGPIANPGKASLQAAMNPAEHDYLYFVADGTGGHAFAKTLEEHNQNVAKWRQIQRQNAQ